MIRRLLTLALVAAGLAAIPLAATANAAPPTLPNGFSAIQYDAGMFQYDLTNAIPIPGGTSLLAIGKSGRVTRVDITGDGLSPDDAQPNGIAQLPVYYQGDRGLLGITVANDYPRTGYVFLLYDWCQPSHAAPTLAPNDQDCIPHQGLPTGRLSRFTVTGPLSAPTGLTDERVLLDNFPSWSPTPGATCTDSHTIGSVVSAPDGTLFVGNGDGSGYCGSLDPGALDAQDILSPRGKIFHITQSGFATADDIPGSYCGCIWATGLRNPFRLSVANGALMVGDVGWNTVEEQDVVHAGNNMGWPCLEGNNPTSTGFNSAPQCQGKTFTAPLLTWNHLDPNGCAPIQGQPNQCTRPAQSAAVGGIIYQGDQYPQAYDGYWFGDYARGDLFVNNHDNGFGSTAYWPFNQPSIKGAWVGLTSIIDGGPNLDHDILVTDIGLNSPGKITRIHYNKSQSTNQLPTVSLTSSTPAGQAPLGVSFQATAADTDGTITGYTWNYGDGTGEAGGAIATHTYTTPGTYHPTVTVTDNAQGTASATLTITIGNNLPILTVVQPTEKYQIGQIIHVSATATDPDGDPVTVTYKPIIHHCPSDSDCHVHPQATQSSPDMLFPDHGDDSLDYYLEVLVTATDSHGGSVNQSVNFFLADSPVMQPPDQPPPPTPPPTPTGLRFNPQAPQRLVDTRTEAPLKPGVPVSINLGTHKAAMLTVTVTNPVDTGYLRAYPCSTVDPQNSTVNYNAHQTISNVTIINIPADGWVCFQSLRQTDLVVDLSGYFDPTGLGYTPGDPLRLFDTRQSLPFGPMQQVVYNINGAPAGAAAAMMNLTVTDPLAPGFLRVYPCNGESTVSNVNYDAGQTIANFAAVQTPGGTMCFRSFAQTDVITDLAGWFVNNGGSNLTSVEPFRLFDTRSTDGFERLVGGRPSHIFMGFPTGTQAAVLNLTVADPSAAGFLSVYPCSTPNGATSNVNYVAHQTAAANMTVVKVPADGVLCFLSQQDTDLIVDVSGYFSG